MSFPRGGNCPNTQSLKFMSVGTLRKKPLTRLFFLAERVGFEPTVGFPTPVFKTGALDHSTTAPNILNKDIKGFRTV